MEQKKQKKIIQWQCTVNTNVTNVYYGCMITFMVSLCKIMLHKVHGDVIIISIIIISTDKRAYYNKNISAYLKHSNNNNNNNHDDIYSAVIYSASHIQEFAVVPLGQSQSAPGGRQLVGQAANLTLKSACRLL